MKFRKELIGATTGTLILSVLKESETHGYEIVRRVNELSGGLFEWQEGTIYPVLHKMEIAGLIEGRWAIGSTGKQRRVYAITSDGSRVLKDQKKEWAVFSRAVTAMLEAAHA
jgi:PadR family transcriptional regulator, regulatory protein PadR